VRGLRREWTRRTEPSGGISPHDSEASRRYDALVGLLALDGASRDFGELRGDGNDAFLVAVGLFLLVARECSDDADDAHVEVDVPDAKRSDLAATKTGVDTEPKRDPDPAARLRDDLLELRERRRGGQLLRVLEDAGWS
jgi:hypothetical protein